MTVTVAIQPGAAYALAAIDPRHREAAAASQVGEWLRWLENRLEPGSVSAYAYRADKLLAMYPDTPLDKFTVVELETVLSRVGKLSKRGYVTAFKSLFRTWALRRKLIGEDPTLLLDELRGAKQRYTETFSDAEVEALLGLPGEDGLRMLLFFDTGLRIAELCNLRIRDVQLERGQLVVLNGKGDKDRVVPLTARLVQAFAEWQLLEAPGRDEYVFGHRRPGVRNQVEHRRTRLSTDALRNWWYVAVDAAGVRRLKPHTSRHTLATTLIRRGAPIAHVSKILGHKSIQTTVDAYSHLVTDDLRGVMELLEA